MERKLKKKLLEAGIDVEDMELRFDGDYELFLRLLKKFPEDKNYRWLSECARARDWVGVENAVHTLKGVVGGLSLKALYELTERQLALIRNKSYDEALKLTDEIAHEYEAVVRFIEKM